MSNKLTAKTEITIDAPVHKVWQALTDPALVKKYLFGTDMVTDWKQGSTITYSGVWNGKSYTDKGKVVNVIPEKFLHTTYFSAMSGKEDKPENYANVIYELKGTDGHTEVSILQDNIEDEKQVEHMKSNWAMVLSGMKKLLEQE